MRRDTRGAVAIVAAVLWPLVASGETDRWVPAVSAFGGAATEVWNANGDSDPRAAFDGRSNVVFPFVGLSAEIMAPAPIPAWGAPRLFVHGDVSGAFDSGWNTAKEGSAGTVGIPIFDFDRDGIPDPGLHPSVASTTGTGTTARHEAEPLRLSAGVGIAFELTLLGRTLRLRPSLEYQWQETEFRLFVSDAESIAAGTNCPCRILQSSLRDTKAFHGIGPGLELDLDAGRAGPFVLSVFLGMQGYHELGGRTIHLVANTAYDDGKLANAHATFHRDAWSFNGTVGLRFHWLPE